MRPHSPLKKKFSRRKFFLPFTLLILLLILVGLGKIRQLNLGLDFNFLGRQEIASPKPSLDKETLLQETLNQYSLAAKNLKLTDDEAVASVSGTTVFFSFKEDVVSQVISLQFILSRAKIEGKLPKVVDLRFSKPVVSY